MKFLMLILLNIFSITELSPVQSSIVVAPVNGVVNKSGHFLQSFGASSPSGV